MVLLPCYLHSQSSSLFIWLYSLSLSDELKSSSLSQFLLVSFAPFQCIIFISDCSQIQDCFDTPLNYANNYLLFYMSYWLKSYGITIHYSWARSLRIQKSLISSLALLFCKSSFGRTSFWSVNFPCDSLWYFPLLRKDPFCRCDWEFWEPSWPYRRSSGLATKSFCATRDCSHSSDPCMHCGNWASYSKWHSGIKRTPVFLCSF